MRFRLLRLRFRRRLRKGQQQVEDLSTQAEQGIDRHLFRRFGRLAPVRRFVFGWLGLVSLLIVGVIGQNFLLSGYYQTLQPVPGGIYNEGVVGAFTTANPIYATNDADLTISHLLFAGLFQYDNQNHLVGDLAKSYDVDDNGLTYTVHLKPNLTWQDGKPLTSADVLFTYQTIQNPDVQSPLQSSWQGVSITTPNDSTIVFRLPDPLAAFPDNLTTGIVPQHLLAQVPISSLRSADFNTVNPIGAGPFSWQTVQVSGNDPSTAEEQITLQPFANYQGGQPKLQAFIVHVYPDEDHLAKAFAEGQLTGAEGLNSVPKNVQKLSNLELHNLLLTAANMVFFKTSAGVLNDVQVRHALVQGSNVPSIIQNLGYATRAVREPLLTGQVAYDPTLTQASYNQMAAEQVLTADGWIVGKDGVRSKANQPLSFTLTASDTPEYHQVADELTRQWKQLGAKVDVDYLESQDFQTALSSHNYDAVLYGISIGVDPDVFVYWDSSQADPRSANRLNLSEWKNSAADTALESGRTRSDPALRAIKYRPFLQAWQADTPALGLYQPRLLYLTDGSVAGLGDGPINTATDRFGNVQNWEIHEAKVTDNP